MTKAEKVHIAKEDLKDILDRPLYHDRMGDYHYDLISAFHKCVRAGDVDASIYWLGRMMEAGEDRLYIIRRMIRIASEDVGMAEPNALRMVLSVKDAFTTLGMPEGDLALYQAAVYLTCAPKSNALYIAEKKVKKLIKQTGTPPVPLSLRNAPTNLMWELGYSKGYVYAHDDHSGALDLEYMPEGLSGEILYTPKSEGFEKRVKEVMDARQKAKRDRATSYGRSSGKKG
jgi:putative ATPase